MKPFQGACPHRHVRPPVERRAACRARRPRRPAVRELVATHGVQLPNRVAKLWWKMVIFPKKGAILKVKLEVKLKGVDETMTQKQFLSLCADLAATAHVAELSFWSSLKPDFSTPMMFYFPYSEHLPATVQLIFFYLYDLKLRTCGPQKGHASACFTGIPSESDCKMRVP